MRALLPLVQTELRLRLRRVSTVVVLLTTLALSWFAVSDPRTGVAMMVIHKARMAYESGTVAFGSASIASALLSLLGFYLVRGRSALDLRSGVAGVLAATPTGNARLLASRWLGAFAYLMLLQLALVLGGCVLQLIRGEGPLQPLVYGQTYALLLTPALMLATSFALLADAWAPLMGRRGDVAYFFVWAAQLAVLPATLGQGVIALSPVQALDVSGLAAGATRLALLMETNHISIGGSPFDPALPMRHFPAGFWNAELLALRGASAAIALGLALPAAWLFHRFDPQRVRGPAARRPSWLRRLLMRLMGPARWPAVGLLRLAQRLGGRPGAWLADLSLTLMANPWAVVAVVLLGVLGQALPADKLPGLLAAACALWGLAISEVAARDAAHATAGLVAAAPGGRVGAFWRQGLATLGLGLLFTLPVALGIGDVGVLLALLCGLALASGLAGLLGGATRGGRSFLALFLLALFVMVQVREVAWLDVFGFNGSATDASRGMVLAGALLAWGAARGRLGQHQLA